MRLKHAPSLFDRVPNASLAIHNYGREVTVLLKSTKIARKKFEEGTGWHLREEGACKGDVCIPLADTLKGEEVDVVALSNAMGLPLVQSKEHQLWALGPESVGSKALTSAEAPDFELPDVDGNMFRLSSLRGEKVLLFAWAPY